MLIDLSTIKNRFPNWEEMLKNVSGQLTPIEIFANIVDASEAELSEYVTVTSDNISNALANHLLVIIRYRTFLEDKGNIEFEHTPRIVKDYENTIKILKQYRDGDLPTAANQDPDEIAESSIYFTGRRRVMHSGFVGAPVDLTDLEDFEQ